MKKDFANFIGTHTNDCYTAVVNTDVVTTSLAGRLVVAENHCASKLIININKTKQNNQEHYKMMCLIKSRRNSKPKTNQ